MIQKFDYKKAVTDMQKGDMQAFDSLYAASYPVFRAKLAGYLKNEADAEDVLQDSYLVIYKQISTLKDPQSFLKWGGRICINKAVNLLKKRKKEELRPEQGEEGTEGMDSIPASQYHPESDPETQFDRKETGRLLDEIIDGLPEMQRMCFLLWKDDLSGEEISKELDISATAVYKNISHAKKKVKDKVLALEKRGTKLYGLAPIPFILWLFGRYETAYAAELPAETIRVSYTEMAKVLQGDGKGVIALKNGKRIASAAGRKTGTGFARKIVATIAILAAAGGGIGAYFYFSDEQMAGKASGPAMHVTVPDIEKGEKAEETPEPTQAEAPSQPEETSAAQDTADIPPVEETENLAPIQETSDHVHTWATNYITVDDYIDQPVYKTVSKCLGCGYETTTDDDAIIHSAICGYGYTVIDVPTGETQKVWVGSHQEVAGEYCTECNATR